LSHLLALARGLQRRAFLPGDGTGEAFLGREIEEVLREYTNGAITRESASLQERERKLVLWKSCGSLREFARTKRPIARRLRRAGIGRLRGSPLPHAYFVGSVSAGFTLTYRRPNAALGKTPPGQEPGASERSFIR
jgi:hypothetical protein